MGVVKESLCDKEDTVEVEDEHGFSCFYPKNFSVEYDLDEEDGPTSAGHYLDFDMYAQNADAEPGSWVLLTKVSGKAKGKRVATQEEQTEAKVKKMTKEQRAAMLAALQGYESE